MKNQENWKIGDIAICIDNKPHTGKNGPPLRINLEYIVNKIYICECGSVDLDVGLYSNNGTVCKCGSTTSSDIHWCNSSRFIKKRTKEEINEELEKAVNEDDFETASLLKEELDKLN